MGTLEAKESLEEELDELHARIDKVMKRARKRKDYDAIVKLVSVRADLLALEFGNGGRR
jgi:hypothetical protein